MTLPIMLRHTTAWDADIDAEEIWLSIVPKICEHIDTFTQVTFHFTYGNVGAKDLVLVMTSSPEAFMSAEYISMFADRLDTIVNNQSGGWVANDIMQFEIVSMTEDQMEINVRVVSQHAVSDGAVPTTSANA